MTDIDVAPSLADALHEELVGWGVSRGACALVDVDGIVASAGDTGVSHPWASVTKIIAALSVLDVVHDGLLDLDDPAGPPGATVRHLLAHASGLAFDETRVIARPGTRRVYSNVGIDTAVSAACAASRAPDAATLITNRVLLPLGMRGTRLTGPASHGAVGPLEDLARLAAELIDPRVLPARVVADAANPAFPGLAGLLPGYGKQVPNDWGLGLELKGGKCPHWMPPEAPADAFGHFGQAGSFLWVDRSCLVAAVALTGTPFGPWAVDAWPRSSSRWLRTWKCQGGRHDSS